ICLDDMQWAEASSLQLFQFVAMNAQAAPIVLIGAARSEEASAGSPLAEAIGFLQRNHRGTRIDLNPLTSEETTEFVERLLGGTTASLASKLYAHSDGNPFVLEETVRLLAATGKLDEGEIASPQT